MHKKILTIECKMFCKLVKEFGDKYKDVYIGDLDKAAMQELSVLAKYWKKHRAIINNRLTADRVVENARVGKSVWSYITRRCK